MSISNRITKALTIIVLLLGSIAGACPVSYEEHDTLRPTAAKNTKPSFTVYDAGINNGDCVPQIRQILSGFVLHVKVQQNLSTLLRNENFKEVHKALLGLLKMNNPAITKKVIGILGKSDPKNKGQMLEAFGEIVAPVSCLSRIKHSSIISLCEHMSVKNRPQSKFPEIDFVLKIDKNKTKSVEGLYDLEDGLYLCESKTCESGCSINGELDMFIEYQMPGYIGAAEHINIERNRHGLGARDKVKGIILAISGSITKNNPEEFRKVLLRVETENEKLKKSGIKLYLYFVPEVIHRETAAYRYNDRDKKFINDVMAKICKVLELEGAAADKYKRLLEHATIELGLGRVKSILYTMCKENGSSGFLATRVDCEIYLGAIRALSAWIEKQNLKGVLRINIGNKETEVSHPFFEGKKLSKLAHSRLDDPNAEKNLIILGQKNWGQFEIFMDKEGNLLYITEPLSNILQKQELGVPVKKEFFTFKLDTNEPDWLLYHDGFGREFILNKYMPNIYRPFTIVDVEWLKGVLKEAIVFRRVLLEWPNENIYSLRRLRKGQLLLTYDILSGRKRTFSEKPIGITTRLGDLVIEGDDNSLLAIEDTGSHRIKELADKFSSVYYFFIAYPFLSETGGKNLLHSEELTLLCSLHYQPKQITNSYNNDKSFRDKARKVVEIFLDRLRQKAVQGAGSRISFMPLPKVITLKDYSEYGIFRQITFEIDAETRAIARESIVQPFGEFRDMSISQLMHESEKVIDKRTMPVRVSELAPKELLRHGYMIIQDSDKNRLVAPVKNCRQAPLPLNWVMDLPFVLSYQQAKASSSGTASGKSEGIRPRQLNEFNFIGFSLDRDRRLNALAITDYYAPTPENIAEYLFYHYNLLLKPIVKRLPENKRIQQGNNISLYVSFKYPEGALERPEAKWRAFQSNAKILTSKFAEKLVECNNLTVPEYINIYDVTSDCRSSFKVDIEGGGIIKTMAPYQFMGEPLGEIEQPLKLLAAGYILARTNGGSFKPVLIKDLRYGDILRADHKIHWPHTICLGYSPRQAPGINAITEKRVAQQISQSA